MSLQSKRVTALRQRIRQLKERESAERNRARKWLYWASRWTLMLAHEFIRDDVKIRAESLAFLMIFSLLPLIAGGFFIFTVFSQIDMVQDALQLGVERFLSTIPEEHRGFVMEYVLHFKDSYLQSMQKKSGSLGIFALLVLVWIGLSAFSNIDKTLNHIWLADRARPFGENLRNFLVTAVVAPFLLICGLSLPLVLQRIEATRLVLKTFPVLLALLNLVIAPALVLGTLYVLYRYVPVRRVRWKSALAGALFATVLLNLSNYAIQMYFKFGTHSAYGKAAAVPILGFWIYVLWTVVILGAEVSYLVQHQRDVLASAETDPAVRDGEALLVVLAELFSAFERAEGSVDFDRLLNQTRVDSYRLHEVLDFLNRERIACEAAEDPSSPEGRYVIARDPAGLDLGEILRRYFGTARRPADHPAAVAWEVSTKTWLETFAGKTVVDLPHEGRRRPRRST